MKEIHQNANSGWPWLECIWVGFFLFFVLLTFCLGNPSHPYTHLPNNRLHRGSTWRWWRRQRLRNPTRAAQVYGEEVMWSIPCHNPDSPQVKVTAFYPIFMSNATPKSKGKVHWALLRWCNHRIQFVCSCIQMGDWKEASISNSSHTELPTTFSCLSSGPSTVQPKVFLSPLSAWLTPTAMLIPILDSPFLQ